ncbi:MAG: hypothetical protein ACK559_06305 [bacterium]
MQKKTLHIQRLKEDRRIAEAGRIHQRSQPAQPDGVEPAGELLQGLR